MVNSHFMLSVTLFFCYVSLTSCESHSPDDIIEPIVIVEYRPGMAAPGQPVAQFERFAVYSNGKAQYFTRAGLKSECRLTKSEMSKVIAFVKSNASRGCDIVAFDAANVVLTDQVLSSNNVSTASGPRDVESAPVQVLQFMRSKFEKDSK